MELCVVLAKELKLSQSSGAKEGCGSDHNHHNLGLFLSTSLMRESWGFFPSREASTQCSVWISVWILVCCDAGFVFEGLP